MPSKVAHIEAAGCLSGGSTCFFSRNVAGLCLPAGDDVTAASLQEDYEVLMLARLSLADTLWVLEEKEVGQQACNVCARAAAATSRTLAQFLLPRRPRVCFAPRGRPIGRAGPEGPARVCASMPLPGAG